MHCLDHLEKTMEKKTTRMSPSSLHIEPEQQRPWKEGPSYQMSEKSEEQSWETTMTYWQPATQEETKPWEGSKNTIVARHKRLGGRIHKRMHNLSTIKNPYAQKAHTAISHPHWRKHAPILDCSNGPNHGTTSTERTRCHTNNCKPQMLQSSPILAMFHAHLRSRNHTTIP